MLGHVPQAGHLNVEGLRKIQSIVDEARSLSLNLAVAGGNQAIAEDQQRGDQLQTPSVACTAWLCDSSSRKLASAS